MWTELASMHVWRSRHVATLLADGRVLVCGGIGPAQNAEIYDPAEDRWRPTPPMVRHRWNHTATILPDGNVLVVGGQSWDALEAMSSADAAERLTNVSFPPIRSVR